METAAHIDFEGASPLNIKKTGAYRWMEDPAARCWCMSWRIGNSGPVKRWHPGDTDPLPLLQHVAAGGKVVAHNAGFEHPYWNLFIRKRVAPHWPELRIEQMDCTMARCATLAIPQSLDFASLVLGSPAKKDKEGHALMLRMSRPRKAIGCFECDGLIGNGLCWLCGGTGFHYTWWDDAERIARLGAYCDDDVRAETAIDERAPALSPRERRVWELDHRINVRGIALDVPTIRRAIAVRDFAKRRLDAEMAELTGGAVRKCSEAKKLAEWITAQGIECTSVAKGEQEDLLLAAEAEDVPAVATAIELRREAGKSSTAKLDAMLEVVCEDGRARGLLHYHGAATGRWAGRLLQPHNLYRFDPETDGDDIVRTIEILTRCADPAEAYWQIELINGSAMTALAKSLRQMIVAGPGCRFVGGDLSNIEGCFAAWVTDEGWKVIAYRENQAGLGPDLYRVAYVRSFGGAVEEAKGNKRQVGKVQELAFQFQGGIGSFISMGANYNVKAAKVVPIVYAAVAPELWTETAELYSKPGTNHHGLTRDEWTALRITVDRWRAAHPAIVKGWYDLQDAAIEAVANPGVVVPMFNGRVNYLSARGFLWCQLPSGRVLAYCKPRIRTVVEKRAARDGSEYERIRRIVDFDGYNGEKKKWDTFSLYGGLQFENIVQAGARDVLVEGMFEAEARGYPIVLTVHDELLTECPIGFGSKDELKEIMSRVPGWCAGLPLAAKCWEDVRYAK